MLNCLKITKMVLNLSASLKGGTILTIAERSDLDFGDFVMKDFGYVRSKLKFRKLEADNTEICQFAALESRCEKVELERLGSKRNEL